MKEIFKSWMNNAEMIMEKMSNNYSYGKYLQVQ